MNAPALILASSAIALASLACGGNGAPGTAATPRPTATAAAPTPVGPAEPGVSPVPRATGIPAVDAVIDALASGDPARVRSVVGYVRVPCEVDPQGIGVPPACRADEPEGTPVEVFRGAQCEGYYLRPDEMDQTVQAIAGLPLELYAVFEAEGRWPEGDYVALFVIDRPERDAVAATIAGGRMVGFHFGCAMTPESYLEFYRVSEFMLPPP